LSKISLPLSIIPKARYLYFIGILSAALCWSNLSFAQTYNCNLLDTDFSDASMYTLRSDDCDSNTGTFGYENGSFVVNDVEGFNCSSLSGDSQNEIRLSNVSGLQNYRNITLTLDYEIEDRGDGFECSSVFGNGDDQIAIEFIVDGNSSGKKIVFCEDSPAAIQQVRRAQFAIPNGSDLRVIVYAGTQSPTEFLYLNNIKVCGIEIDASNPPADPPPPDETVAPFQTKTENIQCSNVSTDILPSIVNAFYTNHAGGSWLDADDNAITEIIPSSQPTGLNLFRYVLPDGNISEFSLVVINVDQGEPILGPYCMSNNTIDLPELVNGYGGSWQGDGTSGTRGRLLRTQNLDLGTDNLVSFAFEMSGCFIDYKVEIIEPFQDLEFESCPPGVINLLDSFPNITKLVEEIDFRDFNGQRIPDPGSVDMANFSGPITTFVHELPDVGCKNDNRIGVVVDTSCPNSGDALSARISIDPSNGNICEGECGEIRVDVTGGTPPYEVKFRADLNVRILQCNRKLIHSNNLLCT